MRWQAGDVNVRREIWRGKPWFGSTVRVVRDDDEVLATYAPQELAAGGRWWADARTAWGAGPEWTAAPLPKGWDVV